MHLHFTSDWHLGHDAIIKMQNRPFKNAHHMAMAFVESTNERVGIDDRLYFEGDLSHNASFEDVAPFIAQIRCRNKYLVFGNHDKKLRKQWEESGLFVSCCDFSEINPKGFGYKDTDIKELLLFHRPIATWNKGHHKAKQKPTSLNLHGHLHSAPGTYNEEMKRSGILRFDVGVDANGYRPVSLDEILKHFNLIR